MQRSVVRLSPIRKTFVIPQIAINKTYDKGSKTFQDFVLLVKIRNSIVHHNWEEIPHNLIRQLRAKGLLLPVHPTSQQITDWTDEISTLETIRWCINVLASLNAALFEMCPTHPRFANQYHFPEFTNEQAVSLLREHKAIL